MMSHMPYMPETNITAHYMSLELDDSGPFSVRKSVTKAVRKVCIFAYSIFP